MKTIVLLSIAFLLILPSRNLSADDWPQWLGPDRNGIWRESDVIDKFNAPRIECRWRVPISSGFSGPTVASGRVFVTDAVTEPEQKERVHCFDAVTGKILWNHSYSCDYGPISFRAGPRASVTIDEGRAYALGAVGHFHCFDAASGKVLWKKDLVSEYGINLLPWGIATSPLVEQGLVILQIGAGDGRCVVAFDKETGQERWTALDDPTSYASPVVVDQAGHRVLVCWTGASVAGLDPITGTLYWKHLFAHPHGWIDAIATPVVAANRLFVSCPQDGSIMLRLIPDRLDVEVTWEQHGPGGRHAQDFHSAFSAPCIIGDHLYGSDNYGRLKCLDANTGKQIWEDQTATQQSNWATTHMIRNGDKTWIFNDRGELVISHMSPEGFELISRARLIHPTRVQFNRRNGVCWSHPAFADKHVFARNDEELVCAILSAAETVIRPLANSPPNRKDAGAPRTELNTAPPPLLAPFTAGEFKQRQQEWAEFERTPLEYTNMLGMKCILIPPGEFEMGSAKADIDRLAHDARARNLPAWYIDRISGEGPQHHVKITRPFYVSQHEVTVKQFRFFARWGEYRPIIEEEERGGQGFDVTSGKVVVGPKYTWRNPGFAQADDHPVVNVSWNDAVAFCDYLTSLEGDTCRLPTEAEWEYACRCGSLLRWSNGDDENRLPDVANVADNSFKLKWPNIADQPISAWDDGYPFTAPVGQMKPNAFGLYDMHGNVWEWCRDWYDRDYYQRSSSEDPAGPSAGEARVLRGGSWDQAAPASRSAVRHGRPPSERSFEAGFRMIQTW